MLKEREHKSTLLDRSNFGLRCTEVPNNVQSIPNEINKAKPLNQELYITIFLGFGELLLEILPGLAVQI